MNKNGDGWKIKIQRQPEKTLHRLPKPLLQRIRKAIWSLADNPRPANSRKLVGFDNMYRIRVGNWRVVYTIKDDQLLILVIRIAPRGSAYRNLP